MVDIAVEGLVHTEHELPFDRRAPPTPASWRSLSGRLVAIRNIGYRLDAGPAERVANC